MYIHNLPSLITWKKGEILGIGIFTMDPFKYPTDLWNELENWGKYRGYYQGVKSMPKVY
jgi:hypothetical protein